MLLGWKLLFRQLNYSANQSLSRNCYFYRSLFIKKHLYRASKHPKTTDMCNGSFSKFTSEIFWEVFRRFSFTTIQNIGITRVGFLIQFTMACRVKHCTSRTALIDLASRIWKTLNLNNLIYQREILDQVDYFDTHSLFLSYELNFAVLKHNLTSTG